MTILLTLAGPAEDDAPGARTGGIPLVPADFMPVSGKFAALSPARSNITLLDATDEITRTTVATEDYYDAREQWSQSTGRAKNEVLGKLGGAPDWIQNDETPRCASCGNPMAFVVELEEGPDFRTAINFGGGGCGYAFTCAPCQKAAFCWQR
ncbi:MAG TPA: hypothetical protein VGN81_41785 [Pseudonocardiaceae bacterium]